MYFLIYTLHLTAGLLLAIATAAVRACRIDTHFHALPPAYLVALSAAGGDPSGYPTPEWSLDAAVGLMNVVGNSIGILSISSPGVPIAGTGDAARQLARTLNQNLGDYSTNATYYSRIGFFGSLPDWQDVNGTIKEIDYLYGQQKLCAGVVVFTTYGGKLPGHPSFAPIWAKLQAYKALVFLHPALLDITPMFVGAGIPQPIIDYPLATTRAAVDLVITGTIQAYPDVDIILSHAGGTVPFVGSRVIGSLILPAIASKASVNVTQAIADFKRFYYDIALSTSAAQLDGLLDFADSSKVLFGSDFPYAPQNAINAAVFSYENFVASNSRGSKLGPEVLRSNAVNLLNKHSQGRTFT
ncbi:hypothetical protein B0O99DRAFT_665368 [Bisporella sp. PMI_857]|nr:hypothetical protein B0O99DRAFT_665368 [Bisporella sp. PMI_857]